MGDGAGPSVIDETYTVRVGQRGGERERERRRGGRGQHSSREMKTKKKTHQGEGERPHLGSTWMMSAYGGRGSLMTTGTAVLFYP